MSHQFTHLVMSGGGLCGVAYLGAMRFLQVEGFDRSIQHVAGTSIGAFFATVFALRLSLEDVEKQLITMLDGRMQFAYPELLSVIRDYGCEDNHALLAFLRSQLDNTTFLDLVKRTGVHLVICATHVKTMKPIYFSVDATPNVLVYDAVRASMAVPWLMKPVTIGTEQYIDGGITDNLPFAVFPDVSPMHMLIWNIHAFPEIPNVMASPLSYTYAITQSFTSPAHLTRLMSKIYPYLTTFNNIPMPFLPVYFMESHIEMKTTKKQIDDAIMYGYEVMYEALKPILIIKQPSQT